MSQELIQLVRSYILQYAAVSKIFYSERKINKEIVIQIFSENYLLE